MKWPICALLCLVNIGCINRIVPPRDVAQPVTIYLLDLGKSSSLVLPTREGHMVRYAYGNWNWYALGHNGFFDAISALFFVNSATLARRELPGPLDEKHVRQQVGVDIQYIYPLQVDRRNVDCLRTCLDEVFQRHKSTMIFNRDDNFYFVRLGRTYSGWHNSNVVMSQWLEVLGAKVNGWPVYSAWRIEK